MFSVNAVVEDEIGLHARPANLFVRSAKKFESDISVQRMGNSASYNAKSILSVLQMAAVKGTNIIITASGCDEVEACLELKKVLESETISV
ncbi:MAG: HPr family phosphocarrier protein [Clostridiales bacterium]|nr:HPr family phosphocarrier protein [Clostridiales bacterium]